MSRAGFLLAFVLAGFFVAAGAIAIVGQQGLPAGRGPAGGRFTMVDTTGSVVTEATLREKPTAIYFGYTYCPDFCPTTLVSLTDAMRKMGRAADRLNVVFVTIDPQRDTPEQMALYLSSFDPRIKGFTGTEAQVASMARNYHAFYRRVPTASGDYTMEHSTAVQLFDVTGRIRGEISYGEKEDSIFDKLLTLAEPGVCRSDGTGSADLWAPSSAAGYPKRRCGSS